MDESLSEFQETKTNCAGPKTTAKKTSRTRKAPKRPVGQKDIRTALRSKKNELESYSKDFDKVCKKAGIDVDSEQLQLAIALSKSLQDTASTSNESTESSQAVTTQDKLGKIRTTLLEYGFKVPEVKISTNTRKTHKHRKNYKLIQTSDVEKKEIIANRYSQVLFQNITHCSLYYSNSEPANKPIYFLASNVTYNILRIIDTFYVENLIEKSVSEGNFLRDWSKIPGRPKSPRLFEPISMNFSEIECSQDELDIVLSGSLKRCKDVVREKLKGDFNTNPCKLSVKDNLITIKSTKEGESYKNSQCTLTEDKEDVELLVEPISGNTYRSCSPDMFGEDTLDDGGKNVTVSKNDFLDEHKTYSEVMDLTEPIVAKSQSELIEISNRNATNTNSYDMELTECMQIESKNHCVVGDQTTSQLSQKTNVTKRRSHDFMELTECVAMSHNYIDLTQSSDIIGEKSSSKEIKKPIISKHSGSYLGSTNSPKKTTDGIENKNAHKKIDLDGDVLSLDLTQSSNTSDELPFVSLTATKEKLLDETIIVNIDDYTNINRRINSQREGDAQIDLTQNNERYDEASMHSQSFFEEYNHDHSDNSKELKEIGPGVTINEDIHDKIDLTQCTEEIICIKNNNSQRQRDNIPENSSYSLPQLRNTQNSSQIVIEYSPDDIHLSNSPTKDIAKENISLSPNRQHNKQADKIDLTQKSDTSEELAQTPKLLNESEENFATSNNSSEIDIPSLKTSQNSSRLSKEDDMSIDYDEIININTNNEFVDSENPALIIHENQEENIEIISKNNSFLSNCSQNSDIFEISDKELDYSVCKSKLEIPRGNFVFGGISVMDHLSNLETPKKLIESDISIENKDEIEKSYIMTRMEINKSVEINPLKHRRITEIATPQTVSSSDMFTAITPTKSEMIIKTSNVTPLINFESMSTPDIHKELDKYGIKPFKRKRAIKLLTHIYNETHPLIENANDLDSPPKRSKPNEDQPTFSKKLISPRKLLASPRKSSKDTERENVPNIDKENDLMINEDANGIIRKGKGKSSLKVQDSEVSENACGIENMDNRRKEVVTNETLVLNEIECSPADWVFQKREKAKVHSCRVPLHIAFYNYVSSQRRLREAILCYEPVEIDLIHKDLVGHGYRYDPKELLKFLDKKCVTVKTTDNDARNHKR